MKIIRSVFFLFTILSLVSCATSSLSLSGKITREGIRLASQLKSMKNGDMLMNGKNLAKAPSVWIAPKGYRLTKYTIDGLPMELLEQKPGRDKVILQLHGGAYIIGFMDLYRNVALKYSKISNGASVLSIDYRLAPSHTYPDALLDALAAWNWLIGMGYRPENITIVGDSAGGNLALALTAILRDRGSALPGAIVCMSPWTDLAAEGDSYTYNLYNDPIFGIEKGEPIPEEFWHKILAYAGNTDLHDKYLSPAYGEFHGFPRMLIQVGTYEVLESDAITVHKKARAAGVDVTLTRYEGMYHVFQLTEYLPESKKAWKEVERFLTRKL
jgi:epsilon-lactone hydrolase